MLSDDGGFGEFLAGVHGFEPYPWQERLADRAVSGNWPDEIRLPTGSGKSAIIDVAVYALALRPDITPRRIVFVSNNGTVSNHAYKHVERLQQALAQPANRCVRKVRDRLASISGTAGVLNGSLPHRDVHRNRMWPTTPDAPWITVATVDQFGSNLLFRSYGATPRMRPIHAALAGNDCLVILDEPEGARAIAQTAHAVAASSPPGSPIPVRYHVLVLSTGASRSSADGAGLLALTDEDLSNEAFALRILVPKNAHIRQIDWTGRRDLESEILQIAGDLRSTERTVGVVLNDAHSALAVHRRLSAAGYTSHLLTETMRPLDSSDAERAIASRANPDRLCRTSDPRTFIVTTGCIENGSDYSFDALITEAAPLERLRQRFGRLDRRGQGHNDRRPTARGWIVGPKVPRPAPGFSDKSDYGQSTLVAWVEMVKASEKGKWPLEFSPMEETREEYPEGTHMIDRDVPMLLPHHLDAWAQTNPPAGQEPPIDTFLYGTLATPAGRGGAHISVAWRHDHSREALREVPLRRAEMLDIPYREGIRWLRDLTVEPRGGSGDSPTPAWGRWTGYDTAPETVSVTDLRAGDTVVVDPQAGGLTSGMWDPDSGEPVADLGDAAQQAYGRRCTLRLDHRLYPPSLKPPVPGESALMTVDARIREWLEAVRKSRWDRPAWLEDALERVITTARPRRALIDRRYWVVSVGTYPEPDALDGSDDAYSASGTGIHLGDHHEGVADLACAYATRLGIPSDIAEDLHLAGRLHDVGLADPLVQIQLAGGNRRYLESLAEPLAKSLPGAQMMPNRWPATYHEFLGVGLLTQNEELLAEAHDADLVLHLVASHHGRHRSLPLLRHDPEPRTVSYSQNGVTYEFDTGDAGPEMALDMAARFWSLSRRYGPPGLALLESIVRLADHQQSAAEGGSHR